MNLFRKILVVALAGGLVAQDLYGWVFVNQGPAYFAADGRRVALVVAMSLAGGLAAFLFMLLPATIRQRLITGAFLVGVLLTTGCCVSAVWGLSQLSVFLESGERWMFSLLALSSVALLPLVWLAFRRYYRRTCGQNSLNTS